MMTHYVTMTDKFMSDWGMAKGKINKLVISCDTYDEAITVANNAERRDEMIYVNIRDSKPYYNSDRYHVSRHGRTEGDYETWFSAQAWA